jgi:NADH-quinone oxidoreductase subunit L
MTWIINIFILVPLLGFIGSVLVPEKKEILLSRIAFFTAGINLLSLCVFSFFWLSAGHPSLNIKEIVLYNTKGYEFLLDFYFDKITATYLMVGSLLTFLITVYSRYYLHRETGYKRFFITILFFYLGYNLTVLSGNFETLFIGWEILGISSFLLIAFYRDRYLPVRNAVKVFSIYRIGDVGILLAMWASHHLWHENITFAKLHNYDLVHEHLQSHSLVGVFISLMILVAAAAKSAQLPFSSWLPRAMEGPTPSSAIFYGSLSVHFGVFLLLRTQPFWEQQLSVRILIAALGLSTSIIATLIARVQSSIKTQIAYSSIAQIGIIFIEVAAGFDKLALIHFAGNACLRTYQLLVSPSVVSYLIKEQFYNFVPRKHSLEDSLPKRIEYSIYLLSLKEFNLDTIMNRTIFSPLKKIGRKLNFLTMKNIFYYFTPVYVVGMIAMYFEETVPPLLHEILPVLFSFIGLLMVLRSFSERKSPLLSWLLIIMNHFWIALAVSFNEHFDFEHIVYYLSGIILCGTIGFYSLRRLASLEKTHFDLDRYYGHVYEYPGLSFVFLIASVGLMGFPITPTFIGEDLIFSHIHEHQFLLAFCNSLAFIMGGIAIVRMYARLFLGPHVKTYHETPYKSS